MIKSMRPRTFIPLARNRIAWELGKRAPAGVTAARIKINSLKRPLQWLANQKPERSGLWRPVQRRLPDDALSPAVSLIPGRLCTQRFSGMLS